MRLASNNTKVSMVPFFFRGATVPCIMLVLGGNLVQGNFIESHPHFCIDTVSRLLFWCMFSDD